ncbi:hypothetical protein C8Q78DRAFT_663415 [Trametes maxima]|nr:hypothetical protein C8Q78DRAFT_663415 [Trametes maxima]
MRTVVILLMVMAITPMSFLNLALHIPSVSGALVNHVIDDQYGDSVTEIKPTYSPDIPGAWTLLAPNFCGNFCYLDPKDAFGGTLHLALAKPGDTAPYTVVATFTGTAVYVYHNIFPAWSTDLTFFLDDEIDGTFIWAADGSTGDYVRYNVEVYSNTRLSSGAHTLRIQLNGPLGIEGDFTYALFDKIVYTTNSSTESSSSSSAPSTVKSTPPLSMQTGVAETQTQTPPPKGSRRNTFLGTVMGSILGGLFVLVVLIWAVIRRRHRRPTQRQHGRRSIDGSLEESTEHQTLSSSPMPIGASPPGLGYARATVNSGPSKRE